ncbi:hypothetical protein F5144DRAFT_574127 [Chaetomium tenue]|uniref:Uncharacterized protein n=1 Tax=Chaetomium tenue TaxID=1854479 RepID=A0ACB7P8R8_9PEZI|nr:hypothetical protein F5144DRAFT_574127 [Chaetomium globosum]
MATPKYRFISYPYMQDVAAQLASKTPTQTMGCMYVYDLPELAKEVHQIVLEEVAGNIKEYVEAEGKVIRTVATPVFFQLKANANNVWASNGYTGLLVPFFYGTIQILVRVLGGDGEARINWECGSILHIGEGTGIRPLTGDIVFLCNLFRLAVRQEATAEKEFDSDAGASRANEVQ